MVLYVEDGVVLTHEGVTEDDEIILVRRECRDQYVTDMRILGVLDVVRWFECDDGLIEVERHRGEGTHVLCRTRTLDRRVRVLEWKARLQGLVEEVEQRRR